MWNEGDGKVEGCVCVCEGGGLLARVFTIKPKTLKRKRALPNYKGKANRAGVKSLLKSHHFFTSFLSFSSPLPSISFFLPGFLIASTFQQDWLSGKTLITGPDLSIRAGEPEWLTHPAAGKEGRDDALSGPCAFGLTTCSSHSVQWHVQYDSTTSQTKISFQIRVLFCQCVWVYVLAVSRSCID